MLDSNKFKQGLAVLFSVHPNLEPKEHKEMVFKAWYAMLKDIPDEKFLAAIQLFCMKHKKLFPGDNHIALIRDLALPEFTETAGDCMELALEAVSKFGYMGEGDAIEWLKGKSLLIAATVKRFGFRDLCQCENLSVARGQMRAFFDAEKERALKSGLIVSATNLIESKTEKKLPKIGFTPEQFVQKLNIKKRKLDDDD